MNNAPINTSASGGLLRNRVVEALGDERHDDDREHAGNHR